MRAQPIDSEEMLWIVEVLQASLPCHSDSVSAGGIEEPALGSVAILVSIAVRNSDGLRFAPA
jgi:hypothetical protein